MTVKTKPSAPLHPFAADPELRADHAGRGTCGKCGKPGRPGDAQHPEPRDLPPAPDAQRVMDARYDPQEAGDDA
ncbi:hypothetical protein [Catenuloplanes atrovinosus]|uniref:Uncharacterized protein n=1 Tax=Catenuloplanes atrovinosus TaxID=137266 RepID=A0AAE3YUJ6_9ACTN|nr:hypothetical protein [Catenuloplanes atrovinosus]MDR7278912.1 hypothetical protein [Catenuloplanes atrovinosus]